MNDAIDTYRPQLEPEHWEPIAAFVRSAVRDAAPRTVYTSGQDLVALAAYVDWCHRVHAVPLDREAIFTPARIAAFADLKHEGLRSSTVGNYATRLTSMTKALNPNALERRRAPRPPSEAVPPYSPEEEQDLWIWAGAQSTPARQRDARVLLAGTFGAGLTGKDVCDLRVSDCIIDAVGVVLQIHGARPRAVPVEPYVAHIFIDAVAGLPADAFIFKPRRTRTAKNTSSAFVAKSTPCRTVVSTQRARNTWAVRMLSRPNYLKEVMRMWGVTDFTSISRLLQYVPDLDPADYRAHLRGDTHAA